MLPRDRFSCARFFSLPPFFLSPSLTVSRMIRCPIFVYRHLAFERRASLVPTKDVSHRRPCWHRNRRPHLGCTRAQVCLTRFLSYELARDSDMIPFSVYACVQQLYAAAGHGVQDGLQSVRPRKPSRVRHRRQCVVSFSLSPLYVLHSKRREWFIYRQLTCESYLQRLR